MTAATEHVIKGDEEQLHAERSPLKIAILLRDRPGWRLIRRTAELAAELSLAQDNHGRSVELTVGVPHSDEKEWRAAERQLRRRVPSVIVRHVEWVRIPVANAKRMFADLPRSLDVSGLDHVSVPRDWGWNFQDCDLWIDMADTRRGAILPLRPIAHYCAGLPERYIPDAYAPSIHDPLWPLQVETFRMWRQGLVLTSDSDTATDLISYAGVRRERIELIPDLLDALPPAPTIAAERDPYLVAWMLRGNGLDDLRNALTGLAAYYREGGTLQVEMTVEQHEVLANHPSYGGLPHDLQELYLGLPRTFFHGARELERFLPRAGILWSSETAGGEAEYVHDAIRSGLQLLAPSFPLNERAVTRLGAMATLYERDDPLAITDALHQLEQQAAARTEAPVAARVERLQRTASFSFLLDRMLERSHA